MQADLILFVRNEVSPRDEDYPHARWYPHSLVYASDRSKPFEIFARAQAKASFDSVKVALGVENLNELIRLTNDLTVVKDALPDGISTHLTFLR